MSSVQARGVSGAMAFPDQCPVRRGPRGVHRLSCPGTALGEHRGEGRTQAEGLSWGTLNGCAASLPRDPSGGFGTCQEMPLAWLCGLCKWACCQVQDHVGAASQLPTDLHLLLSDRAGVAWRRGMGEGLEVEFPTESSVLA